MPRMTGARFLAETMKGYGVTHVFFVPAIVKKALAEMEQVGIRRVLTHGEKAAEAAEDDREPFQDKMARLSTQLREQTEQGRALDAAISKSLQELGYGG